MRYRPLLEAEAFPVEETEAFPVEVTEAFPGGIFHGEVPLDQFNVLSPSLSLNHERNAAPEADGQPLSRFGARLRSTIANLGQLEAGDVPLGLIRVLEAASVDDEYNIRQLAQTQISRTGTGIMCGALLHLHSPLVEPSLINGRTLAWIQATMASAGKVAVLQAVDAETLRLPRLLVNSADQVLDQSDQARRRLGLIAYSGDDREFIDDILLKGVKEPPLVVPFHIDAGEPESGWILEAVDGARRTTATHEILATLTGLDARLATRHWSTGKGEYSIRDMTAADVLKARQLLTFESGALTGLFPKAWGNSAKDHERVTAWEQNIAAHSPAIRAAHRVRTYFAFVVLHVEAFDATSHAHPSWHVVNDAVRQRHMPKAAAKQWQSQDVWALYAMDLIDALADRRVIGNDQREAFLNPAAVGFEDIFPVSAKRPYRNRLVAIADLAAKGCTGNTIELANLVLANNQERRHSHERGQIIGAQARLMIGLHEEADGASIASTITSMCKDRLFYKVESHPLSTKWTEVISKDPAELLTGALGELRTRYNLSIDDRREVGSFGPHQRALGFLGGLALTISPALTSEDEHLTRTGRGGRGGRDATIGRHEPAVLLRTMMASDEGLTQLAVIVNSCTLAEPVIPVDRAGSPLTETKLRTDFLPKAGESKDIFGATAEDRAADSDPLDVWELMTDTLTRMVKQLAVHVNQMKAHELNGFNGGLAFEQQGLPPEVADTLKPMLGEVSGFLFDAGAFGRIAQRRPGRQLGTSFEDRT
ncbi:MAG: hypothetical protein ACRDRX_27265 [Pseudonocardiaceae bacterium]